jgi:hypothetical protein
MNLPIAVQPDRSLAAALRELAVVSTAGGGACPWCGGRLAAVAGADGWPPQAALCCDECGSELTLDRRLVPRGVRA